MGSDLNPALNISAQVACWLLRKRHETLRSNKCPISNPVPSVYLHSALVQPLSTLIVDEDITLVFRENYSLVHLFHFYMSYNIETSVVNIFAPTGLPNFHLRSGAFKSPATITLFEFNLSPSLNKDNWSSCRLQYVYYSYWVDRRRRGIVILIPHFESGNEFR